MIKELEELLANFNSQQISIVKMSLNRYAECIQKTDLSNVEKVPSLIIKHHKHPARVNYISTEKKTEFGQKEELTRVSTLGPSLQMTHNVKENSQGVINLEQLDHMNPNAYGSSISDQANTSASDIHRSSSSPPSQLLRSSSLSNCSLILLGFFFLSQISMYEEDHQLLKTVVGHVWSQQWAELSITRLVRYMEWSCGWCD